MRKKEKTCDLAGKGGGAFLHVLPDSSEKGGAPFLTIHYGERRRKEK